MFRLRSMPRVCSARFKLLSIVPDIFCTFLLDGIGYDMYL